MACRAPVMARAICSGCSSRARTIQSAIRSAERGPTPGICRSCAIKFRIAAGYSVFLKTGAGLRPGAFPSTAKQAVPAGANKIPEEDHRLPLDRAPSETPYTLPPSVSLDTERLHSRKNRDARYAPAWPRLQAKVVRKFHADLVN